MVEQHLASHILLDKGKSYLFIYHDPFENQIAKSCMELYTSAILT